MKPDWKGSPEWAEWLFWDKMSESWVFCSKRPRFHWFYWSVAPRGAWQYTHGPHWAGNGRDTISPRPKRRNPPKRVPKVKGLDMGCTWVQASCCEQEAGVSLPPIPLQLSIPYQIGTDSRSLFAVRGTSVCGRVTSAPLRKANWLADRLHSIGRFEGRRQSKPGKWTRWGLSECQDGEPIRTKAMGGPAGPEISGEGVPKAFIRRVLTKERGVA